MDHPLPGLEAAAEQLRALPADQREHDVLDEDIARLSPLKHANLNVYLDTSKNPGADRHCWGSPATVGRWGPARGRGRQDHHQVTPCPSIETGADKPRERHSA
ncbi:hypothetical protein GCM10009665_39440 [Kitasatospora nipponensis]|uniref:Tn3 transposase DDE domain-containing protein n=1 Tax=Kitasatospora nipponensis TaxID=258049 RepID=A0ABP4GZ73_9ACTN